MRLDYILGEEQLVDRKMIDEALEYQKQHGGRLESHLFRFGSADEATLLKALSRQFRCKSVSLSGREIPDSILAMMPPETAFQNIILPFDYDPQQNLLRIACENPANKMLMEILEGTIPGRNFEIYIALGAILKAAIVAGYRNSLAYIDHSDKSKPVYNLGYLNVDDLSAGHSGKHSSVLVYDEDGQCSENLLDCLEECSFEISRIGSLSKFIDQYERMHTDIMVLVKTGTVDDICELVGGLISRGIRINQTPTIILTGDEITDDLMPLLNSGIEDVVSIGAHQIAVIKLNRIRKRLDGEKKRYLSAIQNLGTHGTLEDMNVIDIIQAMGPSEKTVCISITGSGNQLTMYLDRGNIIYAECDDRTGPEAVYLAIPWDKGVWSVDPIDPGKLPAPNNFQSNESILLEGCRRLDENNREENQEFDFLKNLTE